MATSIASGSQASSSGVLARIEKVLKYVALTVGFLFELAGGALIMMSAYILFFSTGPDFYPQTMAQCMAGALAGAIMIVVGIGLTLGSMHMRPHW